MDPEIVLPDNLTEIDAAELDALAQRASEAFERLSAEAGDKPTSAQVKTLTKLTDAILGARGEHDRRETEGAENAAALADLHAKINPPAATDAEPVEVDPAAEAEVVAEAEQALEGDVVTASGAVAKRRPSIGDAARKSTRPAGPAATEVAKSLTTITASAEVPGLSAGQELSWADAAGAIERRFATLPSRDGQPRVQAGVLTIQKPERALKLGKAGDDQDVIDLAGTEGRLEGNSLVAAGGWCAPSETWYDLCPGLESGAGMVDLPSVNASRGGVRWTQGPQFCDFYSGTGFFTQTEAQAEAGEQKPCFEIPCPDFEECRLDAYGLCLTAGILQQKGYPEYVQRFIQGSLVAHAHRLNAVKIQKMVAAATAVSFTDAGGATSTVLGALELLVEHTRYSYRMDPDASLEAVFPLWLRGVIRSDLAKRNGLDDPFDVTNEDINTWFRSRGVMPQWVYDWQDALCGTTEAGGGTFGGATAPTVWPDEVQVLLYPAGTFVLLDTDVITLDAVYDSALFRVNKFTALFTEEAFCLINRCYTAYVATIDICASGVTGAQTAIACPSV